MNQGFVEFIKNKKGFKRRFRLDSISEVEYNPSESKFIHVFKDDKEYQFEDNNFNLSSMKIVNNYLQRRNCLLGAIHKVRCKKLGKSYYGLAKEMPATDKRQVKWERQREKRGFDDTEIWSLFTTISDFIYPRLIAFKEYKCDYPINLTPENWDEILDKMIFAFKFYSDEYKREKPASIGTIQKVQEGMDLFVKYFRDLWN